MAKGHPWQPEWLKKYPWLRSHPAMSREEWEARPTEAPEYVYCVACVEFKHLGHYDCVAKKTSSAARGDKLRDHEDQAHERALKAWKKQHPEEQQGAPLQGAPQQAVGDEGSGAALSEDAGRRR